MMANKPLKMQNTKRMKVRLFQVVPIETAKMDPTVGPIRSIRIRALCTHAVAQHTNIKHIVGSHHPSRCHQLICLLCRYLDRYSIAPPRRSWWICCRICDSSKASASSFKALNSVLMALANLRTALNSPVTRFRFLWHIVWTIIKWRIQIPKVHNISRTFTENSCRNEKPHL